LCEVYNKKWGVSACFQNKIQEMYFNNMDKLKFFRACAEDVETFKEFQTTAKPVFVTYMSGKPMGEPIVGLKGPVIEALVKEMAEGVD